MLDAALHRVILFGGQDNNVYFSDTWKLVPAPTPTPTPTPNPQPPQLHYINAHSISYSRAQSHSQASSHATSSPDAAMIPHLSDFSPTSGRIRRNNSGKFDPYLVGSNGLLCAGPGIEVNGSQPRIQLLRYSNLSKSNQYLRSTAGRCAEQPYSIRTLLAPGKLGVRKSDIMVGFTWYRRIKQFH